MHYRSLVGIAAVAMSLVVSSNAFAQSAPDETSKSVLNATARSLRYRLEPSAFSVQPGAEVRAARTSALELAGDRLRAPSAYKLPAPEASSSDVPTQTRSDRALGFVPEQATKSAAYKWEAGFLVLSAIDAAETISCVNRATCTEHNPIWGHHPSTGKLVAAKLGLGLLHFGIFKAVANHDPHAALRVAQISAAVQGGVVFLNLQTAF